MVNEWKTGLEKAGVPGDKVTVVRSITQNLPLMDKISSILRNLFFNDLTRTPLFINSLCGFIQESYFNHKAPIDERAVEMIAAAVRESCSQKPLIY